MARPREFDQEKVINKITLLFWTKGFKGTSMDDLVKATKLNKGSLYTCFGNKEEIFKMALNHYASQRSAAPPRKKGALETLCEFYTSIILEAGLPKRERKGCFLFNSCLEFGNQAESLTLFVLSIAKKREEFFRDLINGAQEAGEISKQVNPKSAAQRAFATAFTIREMSKFKPEKDFLCDIANSFLESIHAKQRIKISEVHHS